MEKSENDNTIGSNQKNKVDSIKFNNDGLQKINIDRDCLKFLKPGFKTSVLQKNEGIKTIFISSYVPRKCGIATYTKDLTKAIDEVNSCSKSEIIALNKPEDNVIYPSEVKFKINQDDLSSYIKAGDYINKSSADIVVLEHEFGLYGGRYGDNIIKLLELIKKPLIITTHTIPDNPDESYGRTLRDIICFGEKIIVMMPESTIKLKNKYGFPKKKIALIAHGVPDIPYEPNDSHKKEKGLEGRIILGNINLLSESKGLEYIIDALKEIKTEYNNILYLIIGQTHPVVIREFGEKYRNYLTEKIKEYDLTDNVRFINKYLTLEELIEWLKVIDIYITPYLDPEQSASGALAYAIGAGKVCISTPYLYAKNVLAGGRGVLVPFRNSSAIAEAVIDICKNPQKKMDIEKETYKIGRLMIWNNIALQHLDLFYKAINKQSSQS
ncbi:MAG: glycosyltransferase family 4 protein [Candidatus Humimicrobiaceae bacterium]